jgi:thiamine biosynthesis lipoprotein
MVLPWFGVRQSAGMRHDAASRIAARRRAFHVKFNGVRSLKKVLNQIIAVIILMFLLPAALSSCGGEKVSRYEAEFINLFDTLTTIVAYTGSKEEFTGQAELIYNELEEYHKLYDIYNDYEGINNIKTINDNAGVSPVKVDKRIIDLVEYARTWYEKTDGRINIAMGAVLKIWHDYREAGLEDPEKAELPPADKLGEASLHTDFSKVIVDRDASTVFIQDPEMSLDVGAIAKGYAVEQVAGIAEKNGFTSGLISVGGNVRAIGGKGRDSAPWSVGIRNPFSDESKPEIHTLNLADMSLVTSGSYERYYTVDGKNYHHIINPETLYPSDYFIAISIVCRDSGMADALSTAVFNMPYRQGLEFIESLPDVEAMWIMPDGRQFYSSHFNDFLKK